MTKKYLNTYWNETRLDCGIRHRTLDRGTTLCKGQKDKEEAQNIQDLKCHDRNECWRKASKDQRGTWTVARLIVISRSRPQLDLKECIGTYEFGVIPRSLFASYGTVFLVYDKAKILHHIELLVSNEQLAMHTPAMKTSTSIASNDENTKIWKHQRVHMLQT